MNIQCYKHNVEQQYAEHKQRALMQIADQSKTKDLFFQSTLATEMWKTETTPL